MFYFLNIKQKSRVSFDSAFCRMLRTHRKLYKKLSVVAAATEHKNDGKDDYPSAIIIEDVAEAVVVHICSLRGVSIGGVVLRSILYYAAGHLLVKGQLKSKTAWPSFITSLASKGFPFLEMKPESFEVFPLSRSLIISVFGMVFLHTVIPTLKSHPSVKPIQP